MCKPVRPTYLAYGEPEAEKIRNPKEKDVSPCNLGASTLVGTSSLLLSLLCVLQTQVLGQENSSKSLL